MLPYLLSILSFLIIHPIAHWYLIEHQQKFIDHYLHNLIAIIAIMALSALAISQGVSIENIVCTLISIPSARWLIHDSTLNHLRDKDIDYIGTAAKTDIFLAHTYLILRIPPSIIKLLAFVISVTLSLILKQII